MKNSDEQDSLEWFASLPDDDARQMILDHMQQSEDVIVRDNGLFLSLLFSPLIHKTTGESWPDSTTGSGAQDACFVWNMLTKKRYEFAKGNYFVATEIYDICKKMDVETPRDVLEWLADNPEQQTAPCNKRARKLITIKRLIRMMHKNNQAVFGIDAERSIGWIVRKLEADGIFNEKGEPFSDHTVKDYCTRGGKNINKNTFGEGMCHPVQNSKHWQERLIKRYPPSVQEEWQIYKRN